MNRSWNHLVLALSIALLFVVAPLAADDKAAPVKKPTAAEKPAAKPAAPAAPAVKPTEADVPYGKHPKQVVDFYKAESNVPTPVVVNIHGGAWTGGSKAFNPSAYLARGMSVVSVEYRFIPEATADGVVPPVLGPLGDAARAIQFIRSKAKDWNLDKTRLGATGGSAGAASSLWLAFHDDLADPKSADPVARESTRLTCAAVSGAQTCFDPQLVKEWMPNAKYGGHAFGLANFTEFLAKREKIMPWINEYSPYHLVTKDDPAVGLYYNNAPAMGQDTKDPTHSANFGVPLQEKCKETGVECHLIYTGAPDVKYATATDFLLAKLKGEK